MRPTELHPLKMSQIMREKRGQQNVFVIFTIIGSTMGESENIKGVWNAVKRIPKEVTIYDNTEVNVQLNIYRGIAEYLSVRENIYMKAHENTRFFSALNGRATSFAIF